MEMHAKMGSSRQGGGHLIRARETQMNGFLNETAAAVKSFVVWIMPRSFPITDGEFKIKG